MSLVSSNPGNQANALVTVTRLAVPEVKNQEFTTQHHFFPYHSLLMQKKPNTAEVNTLKRRFGNGLKVSPDTAFGQAGIMYGVSHVNFLLASEFLAYIKKRVDDYPGVPPFVSGTKNLYEVGYNELVQEGIKMGLQWSPVGSCHTSPNNELEPNHFHESRQVLSMIEGMEDIENYWGSNVVGGDNCYLVLKMVPVNKTDEGCLKYTFSNGSSAKLEIPTQFKNLINYVPQFVAVSSVFGTLSYEDVEFKVERSDPKLSAITYPGVEFYVGYCLQNKSFVDNRKRSRSMAGKVKNCDGHYDVNNQQTISHRPKLWFHHFVNF